MAGSFLSRAAYGVAGHPPDPVQASVLVQIPIHTGVSQRRTTVLELYVRVMTWLKSEEGQDLVEYALLLGLIAIICIVAITVGGQAISTIWSRIQSALISASS